MGINYIPGLWNILAEYLKRDKKQDSYSQEAYDVENNRQPLQNAIEQSGGSRRLNC